MRKLIRVAMRAGAIGLLLGCLSGCSGSGADAIKFRVGEVHMHQYPSGGHVEVLFVDPPTPLADVTFDSAAPARLAPSLEQNGCQVFEYAKACMGTMCPFTAEADGGVISVNRLPKAVKLKYQPQFGSYESFSTNDDFLVGGMKPVVTSAGTATVPAFSGDVELPMAFNPTTTLDSGLAGGLEISWVPVNDDSLVKVLLSVTPANGFGVTIVCSLSENAGRIRLPDAEMALLPPSPRTAQLEVSRYRLHDVSLGNGLSVVLHGGYSVLSGRSE